jgi:hypothetical protein
MNNFPAVEAIPGVSDENYCVCHFYVQKIKKRGISLQFWDVLQEYNGNAIALTNQAVNNTQVVKMMHRLVAEEKQI